LNVNVWLPELDDELVLELELLELDMAGFNRLHGTATCFPELDELSLVLEEGLVEEDVEDGLVEDGLVEDEDELPEDDEPLSERIAKSTLPELGLMMTSLIVPRFSPDEPCTDELLI